MSNPRALFLTLFLFVRVSADKEITALTSEERCKAPDMFLCNDAGSECIPTDYVCNGVSECSTGKDENVVTCGCLDNEFQCNTTVCIDMIRRCDMHMDCENGVDETDCKVYTCPMTHSKCANHFCVPRDALCDFKNDCGDNSDEEDCDFKPCYSTQYRCNNSQCISIGWVCDGERDCVDGSDETNCDTLLRCDNGVPLKTNQKCDGWIDCDDQSDESSCSICKAGYFTCDNGRCLRNSNVCDLKCDCGTTCEDEQGCAQYSCEVGRKFACREPFTSETLRCIDAHYVCDGINDCWDSKEGTDESACRNISRQCEDASMRDGIQYFPCSEGRCLPAQGPGNVLCNYFYDCINGEDESGCAFPECDDEQFRCDNKQCIPAEKRCNGVADCFDWTDEQFCEDLACNTFERRCDSGQCLLEDKWCDFFMDCPDASDEQNCEYRQCEPWEFRCDNGQCIDSEYVCYGGNKNTGMGCMDQSHLYNCATANCTSDQFKCRNSYCVDLDARCDERIDCPKWSYEDELGCPYPCPFRTNECICKDDEFNCTNRGLRTIPKDLEWENQLTKFILSGNFLNTSLNRHTFNRYQSIIHLDLSNNSIESIPQGCFQYLFRLLTLNLANNRIRTITNGTFMGLSNVRTLYLEGNNIADIQSFGLTGLSNLQTLDLSYQRIKEILPSTFIGLRSVYKLDLSNNEVVQIHDGAFNGLPGLLTLIISENNIRVIQQNVFHGLPSLKTLYTDEFPFCCLARYVHKCYPEPDEFSSCEDLMSNYLLRVSVWILGILAFLGNILVFIWRIHDNRNGKVHSFLITNLAVGDFFMGVYLLIIAVVDSYYRGKYFISDKTWRESDLCKFAGFISTFSSELSVFTLTIITIDRLICIIFPLKLKRLGIKEMLIVMPCIWILVTVLSGAPLFGIDYFENFYGRSGVCLALHITPEKPKGWEYSVFVFLVLNFVSFLTILISYLWMFLVAKKTTTAVRKSKAKSDKSMAKRMTLIVMSDFCCWVPIILLGFASLGGAHVPPQVYAWVAVFVLPLNSAMNPILYTISTAPFMRNIRKRVQRFRKSFTGSLRTSETKHSFIDGSSHSWNKNSMYRQLELTRLRGLKKTYTPNTSIQNNRKSTRS